MSNSNFETHFKREEAGRVFGLGFDYKTSVVLASAKRAIAREGNDVIEYKCGAVVLSEEANLLRDLSEGMAASVYESYHGEEIPGVKPRKGKHVAGGVLNTEDDELPAVAGLKTAIGELDEDETEEGSGAAEEDAAE